MSILSGFFKTKRRRLTENGYKLQSEWTSSQTVVMGDGTDDTNTLEKNCGAIKGITSSLTSTSGNIAASASAVKTVNDKMGGLTFAQDEEGNWGYKPSGADTVIPFKTISGGLKNLTEEVVVEYDLRKGTLLHSDNTVNFTIDFTDLVYIEIRIDSYGVETIFVPFGDMYIDENTDNQWGYGGKPGKSGSGIFVNTLGLTGSHVLHINNPSGSAQYIGSVKVYRG